MQAAAFLDTGWDFDTVWSIEEGATYPYLQAVPPLEYAPEPPAIHSADQNSDSRVDLSELLRVIQFYNVGGYHCNGFGEDGFEPGAGATGCLPHSTDYAPQDWAVGLSELLRLIQFYNEGSYYFCLEQGTEDGYCPGPAT